MSLIYLIAKRKMQQKWLVLIFPSIKGKIKPSHRKEEKNESERFRNLFALAYFIFKHRYLDGYINGNTTEKGYQSNGRGYFTHESK
ncbi:hypothetical protein U473_01175 [Tepidibacillus decaturensis]|uniref:Uncharacterized protein n=1 Tax=Tepidibacillus decaturensis TaxID=1413211 RepID=A0A135L1M1_9BACI|nr:hypothetical protein U473_01175 [Tepidibacillus decaturensis]